MTARSSASTASQPGNPSTSVRRRRNRHGGRDRRARIEPAGNDDAVDRRRTDSAPDLFDELVERAALGSAERQTFGRAILKKHARMAPTVLRISGTVTNTAIRPMMGRRDQRPQNRNASSATKIARTPAR